MSQFYDQASLVMVPSGYKDGKLYSQKPLSTSGELSFSRGSDIEATRVNANGYIEKAKVNLLLQSNSFDTTWFNILTTSTSGQSGYDGTSDAWLLDSTAGYLYQSISATGVHTISVYVKAGTAEGFRIRVDQATDANYIIDLSDGSLISQSDNIAYKSTSVGGGWYRMEMAFLADTITNIQFRITDLAGATTSGTAYIQDAQLNYGLVAQDYIETTTAAVVSGITNDMPRLNYDPANPTCPSLLLEPSRQNLIDQSDYIASWAGANTTVVSNAGISPEGVNNATSITFASGGYWYKSVTIPYTAGTAYTWSIYTNTSAQVIKWGGATPAGTDTYTIEDAGNGWYRQIITRVVSGSGTTNFQPLMDRVSIGVGVEFKVYGAQFEASASYASSLIPTYGSSATRTADACSKTGISSLIGQTEGVLYIELEGVNYSPTGGAQFCSIDNGTSSKRMELFANTSNLIGVYVQDVSAQVNFTSAVPATGRIKIALAYKLNDYALYINGTLAHTDTSATVPTVSALRLFGRYDGLANGSQGVKQALLFKTRLSNSELATLTA